MTPALPAVKPDRLLHELAELWTTMGKPSTEADADAVESRGILRACSLTLIVITDERDDAMALAETLAHLMREHPCRAIVVRVSDAAETLSARVFAQCWKPFGQSIQICCEQVELTVSLGRIADIPSIVSPLAAPDLPRVVWFRSASVGQAADAGALLDLGDKLIFDSALKGAPAFADLRSLAASNLIVGDLAWTRITKLRELIAQLLDGHDLRQHSEVVIGYSGGDAGPEARYLQAWLRNVLQHASVDLRRLDAEGCGQMKSLRIEPDLDIRLQSNCAEYKSGILSQRANFADGSDFTLLSEELKIMQHDPVYERALYRMTPWTHAPGMQF